MPKTVKRSVSQYELFIKQQEETIVFSVGWFVEEPQGNVSSRRPTEETEPRD